MPVFQGLNQSQDQLHSYITNLCALIVEIPPEDNGQISQAVLYDSGSVNKLSLPEVFAEQSYATHEHSPHLPSLTSYCHHANDK